MAKNRNTLPGNRRYFSAAIWPKTKVLIEMLITQEEGKTLCEVIHNAVEKMAKTHFHSAIEQREFVERGLLILGERLDDERNQR